jgi:DNA polymerase-3 subunit gamma/tau
LPAASAKPIPAIPAAPEPKAPPPGDPPVKVDAAAAPSAAIEERADGSDGNEGDDWHALLAVLKLGGMSRELAQHCQLKSLDGERIVLCLSPTHRHLQIKAAQDKLQQALSGHFGRPVRLSIELEEVLGETPAAVARRQREIRQEQAVASVEQDAFVREVIDLFDAKLIDSSIKPV